MKGKLIGIVAIAGTLALLALMRWSTPSYDHITGPIPFEGAPGALVRSDNLAIESGQPQLARAIRYKVNAFLPRIRDTGGVWLVVPVRTSVDRKSSKVLGAIWKAADGRQFSYSRRAENADAALPGKGIQPGLERKDLLVFEVPPDSVAGGTLIVSEATYPRLQGEVRIAYPDGPVPAPVPLLDLDALDAKL